MDGFLGYVSIDSHHFVFIIRAPQSSRTTFGGPRWRNTACIHASHDMNMYWFFLFTSAAFDRDRSKWIRMDLGSIVWRKLTTGVRLILIQFYFMSSLTTTLLDHPSRQFAFGLSLIFLCSISKCMTITNYPTVFWMIRSLGRKLIHIRESSLK